MLDAHSLNRQLSLSGDVVRSIPTARSYNALLALVPGVATNTNDIVMVAAATSFPIHGGRPNEGRLTLDGLNVGSPPSGNSATSYAIDVGSSEEVTFTTATALGETETAGLVMNIVPRSGGNACVITGNAGDGIRGMRNAGVDLGTDATGATPQFDDDTNTGTNGGFGLRCMIAGFVDGRLGTLLGTLGGKSFAEACVDSVVQ